MLQSVALQTWNKSETQNYAVAIVIIAKQREGHNKLAIMTVFDFTLLGWDIRKLNKYSTKP